MRILFSVAAAVALTLPSAKYAQSSAEVMLKEFDAGGRGAADVKMWMLGTQIGLMVANAELEGRGLKPLYCQPEKLALTGDQVVELVRDFVGGNPGVVADTTAGLVVLWAMKDPFPCQRNI